MYKKRILSTPNKVKTPKKIRLFSPNHKKTPEKGQHCTPSTSTNNHAAALLQSGRISRAVEYLFKNSVSARHSIINVVVKCMSSELKDLAKNNDSIFAQELNRAHANDFSWTRAVVEFESAAPYLTEVIRSLLPYSDGKTKGRQGAKRPLTEKEQDWQQNGRLGLVMSILLYNARPNIFKFIATTIGAQICRQGGTQKLFRLFNILGVSAGVKGSRNALDRLADESSRDITQWKSEVERDYDNNCPVVEQQRRRQLAFTPDASPKHPGYAITFDNVQITVKHPGHGKEEETFRLWAMILGMKNRVSFRDLADGPESRQRAAGIPVSAILPTYDDKMVMRERMITVCMRIMADNIPAFHNIVVSRETVHQYSHEMSQKSHMVNLGVIEANPSSTAGTCEILDSLLKHVPVRRHPGGDYLVTVPCHGDGLTVDRIAKAKKARTNHPDPLFRYEGFEPVPQDFHKEMLLMQSNQDRLFSGRSAAARGTKFELKNSFKHRKVKAKVSDGPEHHFKFDKFVTVAYATNLAMDLCQMNSLDDIPMDLPDDDGKQLTWLHKLAVIIVSLIWKEHSASDLRIVEHAAEHPHEYGGRRAKRFTIPYVYCKCGEDKGGEMVQCSAASCPRNWYHLSCVNLTSAPEGDFWCSRECQRSGSYIHCYCRRNRSPAHNEQMVQCERGVQCLMSEEGWFHQCCLLTHINALPDPWFCSVDCELGRDGGHDGVLEYSRKILFEGLRQLACRDMVREGDGRAIISTWKLDLPKFWIAHPNYFPITHQFLTGLAGFYSPRLAMEMTWNRVVNIKGRFGKNIPHDLINEYVNGDFKEMLKHAHGRYTEEHVRRCSLIGGPVGQTLDRLLEGAVMEMTDEHDVTTELDTMFHPDVAKFIEEYTEEDLWTFEPGRFHRGFEEFTSTLSLDNPVGMGKRISELGQAMDQWRDFAVNNV